MATVHALWLGWGRWGSPLADTGRELEWPRRILDGDRLYMDLRFFYGPLAPYVNAVLYRVFGVQLQVLAFAGAVSGGLTAAIVYLLSRRFIGRVGSTAAALTFVYVCAFAQIDPVGIFNFVLPYSYSATYGMLAALTSLLLLLRHLESDSGADFACSVALLAIAALAKLEPFFPIAAAHALFVVDSIVAARLRRGHVLAYAVGAGVVGAVYGGLSLSPGSALWRDNLGGAFNPGSEFFIRWVMGIDAPAKNLALAAASLLLLAGVAGVGAWTSVICRSPRLVSYRVREIAAAVAAGAVALSTNIDHPFRALPFVIAVALGTLVVAWWRRPHTRAALLPSILLWAFALAATSRIVLRAVPQHDGFFMLPAGIVCLAVLLFRYVPRIASQDSSRRAYVAAGLALLLVKSGQAISMSTRAYSSRRTLLRSDRGSMWVQSAFAPLVPILDALERTPAHSTVLVIPHAGVVNFLSRRRGSSDGMFAHLPMDYYGGYADGAVVRRWERQPPDYVVDFPGLKMTDFGGAQFGVTYAIECGRWLKERYTPVTDSGALAVLFARDRRAALKSE